MLESDIYTREYAVTIISKEEGEFPHFFVKKEEGITETLSLTNDPDNYLSMFNPGDRVLLTHMWKKTPDQEGKNEFDQTKCSTCDGKGKLIKAQGLLRLYENESTCPKCQGKGYVVSEKNEQSNIQGTYYGFRLKPYELEADHAQGSKSI